MLLYRSAIAVLAPSDSGLRSIEMRDLIDLLTCRHPPDRRLKDVSRRRDGTSRNDPIEVMIADDVHDALRWALPSQPERCTAVSFGKDDDVLVGISARLTSAARDLLQGVLDGLARRWIAPSRLHRD